MYRTVCVECRWYSEWMSEEEAVKEALRHLAMCDGPCVAAARNAHGEGRIYWRPGRAGGSLRRVEARFRDPAAPSAPAVGLLL